MGRGLSRGWKDPCFYRKVYRGKLSGVPGGGNNIQRPGRELPFKVGLTSLLSFHPLWAMRGGKGDMGAEWERDKTLRNNAYLWKAWATRADAFRGWRTSLSADPDFLCKDRTSKTLSLQTSPAPGNKHRPKRKYMTRQQWRATTGGRWAAVGVFGDNCGQTVVQYVRMDGEMTVWRHLCEQAASGGHIPDWFTHERWQWAEKCWLWRAAALHH